MDQSISEITPVVSVVMAVYNTQSFLSDSIGSILAQTFTNWELICVNDGSSDGSLKVLKRYQQADPRVRVISRSNTGLARARNDGIAASCGRYIAIMDSDDVALPERLWHQVDYMDKHPECVAVGAAVRVVGPDLMPINDEPKATDHETIDRETLAGSGAAIREPVVMLRAQALREIGGYSDEYVTHLETDLFLRLAERGGRLANLPETLLLYRLRVGSDSRMKRTLARQHGRKVIDAARVRRGLPVGVNPHKRGETCAKPERRFATWALWSHYAFNGGYVSTARRYALRAVICAPFEPSCWKAVLRSYFRTPPPSERTTLAPTARD